RSRRGDKPDETARANADDGIGNCEDPRTRKEARQWAERRAGKALSCDRLHGGGECAQGWGGQEIERRPDQSGVRSSVMKLAPINYANLNSRQQEAYNFQKVSGVLADFGFTTIRLTDDWQGADFIAQIIDGQPFLTVQL